MFTNFVYDPGRQGYDTSLWKTVSGTPSISSNKLRLNAASVLHYGDCMRGDFSFEVVVPTAPASGDDKEFGLKSLGKGAYIKLDITDADVKLQIADGSGNTEEVAITWDSDWTNVATVFSFRWEAGMVKLYANGVHLKTLSSQAVPRSPMSIFATNNDADNLDFVFIEAMGVQSYI